MSAAALKVASSRCACYFTHNVTHEPEHLEQSVLTVARRDVARLSKDLTVREALEEIRRQGVGEKIVYFYVVDEEQRLAGVLPTRRLLLASPEEQLGEVMVKRVAALPETATILEACEAFLLHKFLAFPIVDKERRIVGLVDVGLLTEEAFDINERPTTDELFERIGVRVSQVRGVSSVMAFRYRFPWLVATIASGTVCAFLAGAFEVTLAESLVLAFFLTLVLGLGESVSIQSMSVTIQTLSGMQPTVRWFLQAFRREMATATLLGAACGSVVGLIVWLWRGEGLAGVTIGSSILLAICAACLIGLSVPSVLHALRLDPKIAAGPVTLALADIFTLLSYFGLAAMVL